MRKSMKNCTSLICLGIAVVGMTYGASAFAKASSSVTIGELMAMSEVSLGDLVARAKGRDAAKYEQVRFADASAVAKSKPGVSLDRLLAGGTLSFADLVKAARPGGTGVLAPAPVASKVAAPLAQDSPKAKAAPLTVTVTIGAVPNAEPVAAITTPDVQARLAAEAKKVAAVPATAATSALTLEVRSIDGVMKFKPQTLVFPKSGASARISLAAGAFEGLAMFVRDQTVVSFDQKALRLDALKKGSTELYAVLAGKMYIVPVSVEDGGSDWDLKVPDALVSLDGIFGGGSTAGSALYPGLESASRTPTAPGENGDGVTFAESLAETDQTVREVREQTAQYVVEKKDLAYKPYTIQVIDDRSAPRAGKVYPVANAIVRLVGTEFAARTDATGHLTIRDVPSDSRFMVKIDDDGGIVRSGIGELSTASSQDGRVARLRVIRNFSFDAYASIAGVAQHAAYASYCATVVDAESEYAPLENVAVGIDAAGEGPFYFNRYGFLDRALRVTGPDGRFCFYNVAPGPMALSLFEGGAYVATFPTATFPGRHIDEELVVGSARTLNLRLATMGTAHEQLGSDVRVANSYKTIDMIDMIPLGTETPMMQLAPGRVQTPDPLLPHNGRVYAFAQAAEFEPTIYGFGLGSGAVREGVAPLIPRGFVEDMAVYAQVAYNPELGVVMTEYGHPGDVETVTLRLIDEDGRDVGDGWYFSDRPLTKAIFFNVPAGTYALLAETADGFWLGAETVIVYNETVSYARLGAPVRYRP